MFSVEGNLVTGKVTQLKSGKRHVLDAAIRRVKFVGGKLVYLSLMLIVATALFVAGCANLTPSQQTALNDVTKTAIDAGLGYLSGGSSGAVAGASKDLVGDVQDASLALRSMEGTGATQAPSAAQIQATIQTITGSPAVAKALGPKVGAAIAAGVASGAKPDVALEKAATGLDTAAGMMTGAAPSTKL